MIKYRVLALGPQEVFPPTDGGKESIYGALATLAKHIAVTYAYPANENSSANEANYSAIGVRQIAVSYSPRESIWVILNAILRGKPYKFEKYSTKRAVQLYQDALGTAKFDVVLCFHPHTVALAKRLQQHNSWCLPIILREHNIEYELVQSYRDSLSGIWKWAATVFAVITRVEEQRIWRCVDAVAFITDRDLLTARTQDPHSNFLLAPEGVPIPPERVALKPSSDRQLLVLLNPRATQSVANLKQFLHSHWLMASDDPRLQDVSLAITGVGLDQLAELVNMTPTQLSSMRVRALGFVPLLRDTFATSLALVSPTYVGGGIRKKVLEAMANQLPVIATVMDIATCSYFHEGQNILRLGTPAEFIECVEGLLLDDERWQQLSDAGRITVERFASWSLLADVIISEIARLTEKGAVCQ
ncbi:MAG: glycosyltransferase [Thiobacillaceae bacterium]